MLAKIANDNAPIPDERGVLWFFASELAPTGLAGQHQEPQ
ncbi:hypothetical protein C4J97_1073 [Pseudomonas orientalis]|nr:hypothetical protein C4J97_1073 [Pseudomonas orientalis]